MSGGVIRKRLDLVIRLEDTTNGLAVGERNVHFYFNGKELRPDMRGEGTYILINQGRENGLMQIKVYGYEPFEAMVDYEKLDERLPTLDATLIPSESMRPGQEFLAISGQIAGLSSIEAVHIARPLSGLREFDPKRCVMTIYMPNRRMNMVHTHYGLVNTAEQTFEPFDIVEELPDKRVRIGAPLQGTYPQNSPICRLIYGQVRSDGTYLLRIRVTGDNVKHLVRFELNGRIGYHLVDFRDPSTWNILEGFQTEEPSEELFPDDLLTEGEEA